MAGGSSFSEAGSSPSRTLRQLGLRPRKRLGQSFLQDRRVLTTIVEAAELEATDEVLEVGPGTGVLTTVLAERARRVVAVELDDDLYALLMDQFGATSGVELLHANALGIVPGSQFAGEYKVVANIPYYITGPLLRHFLESTRPPRLMVLMVQRDVAERIVAKPGDLSLLGVSVQYYAHPEIIARVPAGAFYPRPRVESAILRLAPFPERPAESEREDFFAVARAGFGVRRKQLVNALQNGLRLSRPRAVALLQESSITASRRAETLTIEEWRRLGSAYGKLRALQ